MPKQMLVRGRATINAAPGLVNDSGILEVSAKSIVKRSQRSRTADGG